MPKEDPISARIVIGNVKDKPLEMYDVNDPTFDSTTCLWSFQPSVYLGYSIEGVNIALAVNGGFPADQRLHYTDGFPNTKSAAVVVSHRWVGIAKYADSDGKPFLMKLKTREYMLWSFYQTGMSSSQEPEVLNLVMEIGYAFTTRQIPYNG